MKCPLARLGSAYLLGALGAAVSVLAPASALTSHPIVLAVRHGDCASAVKLANANVTSPDEQTTFLAARTLEEGICVQKDPLAAAQYFARAAALGNQSAALDYAAKVGLGQGSEQSYERAGSQCRAAGLDSQRALSDYALGYACTLRSLAGELLRENLPRGAFQPDSGAVRVEFNPAAAELHVRTTPRVGLAPSRTGSNLRGPLIDAPKEIASAWRGATAQVPKPDPARLESKSIELPLDVDMVLEVGQEPSARIDGQLNGWVPTGDLRRMGP